MSADDARTPDRHDPGLTSRALLSELIHEICPPAHLVALVAAPPEHYTMRVDVRPAGGKTMILASRLVDDAMSRPAALQALRAALRTDLIGPERGTAVANSPRYRAYAAARGLCAVCQEPIRIQDRVMVRRARIMHAACAPRPL
jgi:hypothetical protein